MTIEIRQITVDCADPFALSEFWKKLTGWEDYPGEPNKPGEEACWLGDPKVKGTALYFQKVPEGKVVKNRLHLDVSPISGTRDDEVERILGLGATLFDDQRLPDGRGWVVLTDPEGNEFCVERGRDERGETV